MDDRPTRLRHPPRAHTLTPAAGLLIAGTVLCCPAPVVSQDSLARFSRQVRGETELTVEVRYAAGQLDLAGSDAGDLYTARIAYDSSGQAPLHTFDGGRLTLGVERSRGWLGFTRGSPHGTLDLRLTTRIPLDLELDLGAARARVDLGGLRLGTLSVNGGASETEIRVSRRNPGDLERATFRLGAATLRAQELGHLNAREITIEAGASDIRMDLSGLGRTETRVVVRLGAGRVELAIPEEAGVRITQRTALGSVDAPGFQRVGSDLHSPNWEEAPMRIEVQAEVALGNLTILHGPR